jgi:hypothetical protein
MELPLLTATSEGFMYKFLVHCLKNTQSSSTSFLWTWSFHARLPIHGNFTGQHRSPGSSGASRIESLSTIRGSDQHPQRLSPDGDLTLRGIRHSNDGPPSRLCGSGETNLVEHHVVSQTPELAVLRMSERCMHCGAVLIFKPRISELFGVERVWSAQLE